MINISKTNEIISVISKMNKNLGDLCIMYGKLPDIFDEEYLAIEKHNLLDLEKVGAVKNELVNSIQNIFNDYCSLVEGVLAKKFPGFICRDNFKGHLSQCKYILADLLEQYKDDEVVYSILSYKSRVFEEGYEKLKDQMSFVVPLINKNKAVVENLLRSHRESETFWKKLLNEESSTYDNQGNRASQVKDPSLNISV